MFYTPIKKWVFDQSERAQGPIYLSNRPQVSVVYYPIQIEGRSWAQHGADVGQGTQSDRPWNVFPLVFYVLRHVKRGLVVQNTRPETKCA